MSRIDIDAEVRKIRGAIYGEEVRASIADGLGKMASEGTISINAAINAANEASQAAGIAVAKAEESSTARDSAITEAAKADISAKKSEVSEKNAKKSEDSAKASANEAKSSEQNAVIILNEVSKKADEAEDSAEAALWSEHEAKSYADQASNSANFAENYKNGAEEAAIDANAHSQKAMSYTSLAQNSASEAERSANSASKYAESSENYALEARSYVKGDTETREGEKTDNAKYYFERGKEWADVTSENSELAVNAAILAKSYANGDTGTREGEETDNALAYYQLALNASLEAVSYAIGAGGIRENESIENAKYYFEQAKTISESFHGALRPMGTVVFVNLPELSEASEGDMYNISDEFTTTNNFKEGAGNTIPAGSNIYKTADGKWDILAGTPVTKINGKTGNVNITAEDISALSKSTKYAGSNSIGGAANSVKGILTIENLSSGGASSDEYDGSENKKITIPAVPNYNAGSQLALINATFKLKDFCTVITDWNTAVTNGFYMANGAANAPDSGWIYGLSICRSNSYVRQIVFHPNGKYERIRTSGDWGDWLNTSVQKAVPSNAKFTDTIYTLPVASSTTRGGVKIGYTANGKNYPVQLNNEQMYVNVPWNNTDDSKLPIKGGTMLGDLIIDKGHNIKLIAGDNVSHILSALSGGGSGGICAYLSNFNVLQDDAEARVEVINKLRKGRLVTSIVGNFGIYNGTDGKWLIGCNDTTAFTQYNGIGTISDERDKTDLQPLLNCLEFINNVNPISFFSNPRSSYEKQDDELTKEEMNIYAKYGFKPYDKPSHKNGEKRDNQRRVGVSAQQTMDALKKTYGSIDVADIVNDSFYNLYKNEEKIPEGVENSLTVVYTGFIPYLIGSIHELTEKIKELEEENKKLRYQLEEGDLNALKEEIAELRGRLEKGGL